MKRAMLLAALASLVGGAAALAHSARESQAEAGVSGRFSTVLMVHTRSQTYGNLPGVRAWDGTARTDEVFAYRSIPCTGAAPVNNIGTDLTSYNARVQGSRVPGNIRAHPFSFRFVRKNGKLRMQGYIELVACKLGPGPTPSNDPVPDNQKPRIKIRFFASTFKVNEETVRFHGRFVLRGGTGRYADLTGSGGLAGYFLCFDPSGCKAAGNYADAQMTFQGTYADPTPELNKP